MFLKYSNNKIGKSETFIPNTTHMLRLPDGQILTLDSDIGIRVESNGDISYKDVVYKKDDIQVLPLSEVSNHLERPGTITRATEVVLNDFWRKRTSFPDPETVSDDIPFTKAIIKAIKIMSKPRPLDQKASDKLLNDVRNLNSCVDNNKEISLSVASRLLWSFGINFKDIFNDKINGGN